MCASCASFPDTCGSVPDEVKSMSLPSKFDHDLRNQLKKRLRAYEWTTQSRVSKETRECVDVAGELVCAGPRRTRPVLIEAELKREDPVSNVLKVWRHALKGGYPMGFIFIQGFSRVYRSQKYPTRRIRGECAIQFGKMMADSMKKVAYIPIRIRYLPRSGSNEGNGARRNAAVRFGNAIVTRLRATKTPSGK